MTATWNLTRYEGEEAKFTVSLSSLGCITTILPLKYIVLTNLLPYCTFSNLFWEMYSHSAAKSFQIPTEQLQWKIGPVKHSRYKVTRHKTLRETSKSLLSSIYEVALIFPQTRIKLPWSGEDNGCRNRRGHTLISVKGFTCKILARWGSVLQRGYVLSRSEPEKKCYL